MQRSGKRASLTIRSPATRTKARQSDSARRNSRRTHAKRPELWRTIREQRPLHRRLALHPLSMFALLCTGVLLYGLTANALADQVISSVVEAPPLQSAATIASPVDGATFKTQPIDVTGTCPADSYINLQVNGAFGGVAWCAPDGTYTITASLFPDSNTLSVQDYNSTDLVGPSTPSITVTYIAPVTPPTIGSSPTTSGSGAVAGKSPSAKPKPSVVANGASPLLVTSSFAFKSFSVNQPFSWKLGVTAGSPPYTVRIDWGDNQSSDLVYKSPSVFTLTHRYAKPGYYPILVRVTDSKGQLRVMQLAALIKDVNGNEPFMAPTGNGTGTPAAPGSVQRAGNSVGKRLLTYAWPIYLILVLMTVSFWLGEVRQYQRSRRLAHK